MLTIKNILQYIGILGRINMSSVKKIIISIVAIFILVIISSIVLYKYINSSEYKMEKLIKDIKDGKTFEDYGIKDANEYVQVLRDYAYILKLPMGIESLIDFDSWKTNYRLYAKISYEFDCIRTIAYSNLIEILATNDYDSSKYPLTDNYKNKFNNKSFIREVPNFNYKLGIGIGDLDDKCVSYNHRLHNIGYDENTGEHDATTFTARYKLVLDDKGYIDDIAYIGVYKTMDKSGERELNDEVQYVSFQESEAEKCIKDLFDNVKQIKERVSSVEDSIKEYGSIAETLLRNYTIYIYTDFLYTDNFKEVFKEEIRKLPNNEIKSVYVTKKDGKKNIDLKNNYCQVCVEYDDKNIYYDIHWEVDEDYFLDSIKIDLVEELSK